MTVDLKDLSSVLEVSVGLHLAYSLLSGVREATLLSFRKTLMIAKDYLPWIAAQRIDADELLGNMLALEGHLIEIENENDPRERRFVVLSVLVVVAATTGLVLPAFFPGVSLGAVQAAALCLSTLAPMPGFVMASHWFARRHLPALVSLRAAIRDDLDELAVTSGR